MPKIVDHALRREQIADALLRVVSRDGLAAVSLRHVATEAGVTAGMVQHYFPSKDDMLAFAMTAATTRYAQRITAAVGALGDSPAPRTVIRALLAGLIPASPAEVADARIALAFQAHAAVHPDAAAQLAAGGSELRAHLAALVREARPEEGDPARAAVILVALAEGLAVQVLTAGLPAADALAALDAHLAHLA